jgi:hypothetical protein
MSERAQQLFHIADEQISDLIALLSAADEAALHAPCPGREKLGDGTVAAIAMHSADNYHRIADFLGTDTRPSSGNPKRRHRTRASLTAHDPRGGHDHSNRSDKYRSDNIDRGGLLERLAIARARLSSLAVLSDERLGDVPPASDMRFADGQRTLEQIVVSLLNHQHHQCEALTAALASSGRVA